MSILYIAELIYDYNKVQNIEYKINIEDARTLNSYVISFRQVYQKIYADNKISMDENNSIFLPVFNMDSISKEFSERTKSQVTVRVVSDIPMNPLSKANSEELEAINFFQRNKSTHDYSKVIYKDGKKVFFYAYPLFTGKLCLKCHGKRGDVIDFVKNKYSTAMDYNLGDVRGIISIHMDREGLSRELYKSFFTISFFIRSTLFILLLVIIYFIVRRIRRDEDYYTNELEKNVDMKTRQIKSLLTRDMFTGLPNRASMLEYIKSQKRVTIFKFDIVSFANINECYGTELGDEIILEFSKRFLKVCEENDLVAFRDYGDKFFAVCSCDNGDDYHFKLGRKIVEYTTNEKYVISDISIYLNIYCGIATGSDNALIDSDLALKSVKNHYENVFITSGTKLNKKMTQSNFDIISKIKYALSNDRVITYYQPIISADGKNIFYESLVRMLDEDGTIIVPIQFLETAKKSNLYPSITRCVIKSAFSYFYEKECSFSINISTLDIVNPHTIEFLKEMLLKYRIGHRFIIEILETESFQNYEIVKNFIEEMKHFGCRIAIDDFGAGYSNYERLINMNIDFLKIDGKIVRELVKDNKYRAVLRSIVGIAREMKVYTVAEYVFDGNVATAVKELGVDYLQGYHFGAPSAEIIELSEIK